MRSRIVVAVLVCAFVARNGFTQVNPAVVGGMKWRQVGPFPSVSTAQQARNMERQIRAPMAPRSRNHFRNKTHSWREVSPTVFR